MKMFSILSDLISGIEYDSNHKLLTIYFTNNTEGYYFDVPDYKVNLFIESPFPDSFYSTNFKNNYHEIIINQE